MIRMVVDVCPVRLKICDRQKNPEKVGKMEVWEPTPIYGGKEGNSVYSIVQVKISLDLACRQSTEACADRWMLFPSRKLPFLEQG